MSNLNPLAQDPPPYSSWIHRPLPRPLPRLALHLVRPLRVRGVVGGGLHQRGGVGALQRPRHPLLPLVGRHHGRHDLQQGVGEGRHHGRVGPGLLVTSY